MKLREKFLTLFLTITSVFVFSTTTVAQRSGDWPDTTKLVYYGDDKFPVFFSHPEAWKVVKGSAIDGRLSLDTDYKGHLLYSAQKIPGVKGTTPEEYVAELQRNSSLLFKQITDRDSTARLLNNGRTSLDGRPAYYQKVSGTHLTGYPMTTYQLYCLVDISIYLFQMSSPTSVYATAFEDFSRILRTVEIKK